MIVLLLNVTYLNKRYSFYTILKKFRISYMCTCISFNYHFLTCLKHRKNYLITHCFLKLFITKSAYHPSYHIKIIACTIFYYDLKTFFLYIRKWESGTLQKWGKVCNVADLPPGKICNDRGKVCNVANLPPRRKVCNVADLPGEGLQCCRSSGGKVCNVADLPGGGGGLQGGRSAIQHRTVTIYTPPFPSLLTPTCFNSCIICTCIPLDWLTDFRLFLCTDSLLPYPFSNPLVQLMLRSLTPYNRIDIARTITRMEQ